MPWPNCIYLNVMVHLNLLSFSSCLVSCILGPRFARVKCFAFSHSTHPPETVQVRLLFLPYVSGNCTPGQGITCAFCWVSLKVRGSRIFTETRRKEAEKRITWERSKQILCFQKLINNLGDIFRKHTQQFTLKFSWIKED